MLFNIFLLNLLLNMKKPPIIPLLIGTGLGSGFWPWGPGTAGSLVGVIIWYVLSLFFAADYLLYVTLAGIVLFTISGTWATNRLMPYWGDDPKRVVIDEIAGVWVPLTVVSTEDYGYIAASLVLFRLFDIFKPLGIRYLDNRKGAFYVIADDLAAGAYSLIVIMIARWII